VVLKTRRAGFAVGVIGVPKFNGCVESVAGIIEYDHEPADVYVVISIRPLR